MVAKSLILICTSALFLQNILAQCVGNSLAAEELAIAAGELRHPGLAGNVAYGASPIGYGGLNAAQTSGGSFAVTSSSPISPTGISVVSENAIEGALSVTGEIPFLGAVALEGILPTAGVGAINYDCGNGAIGIVSEGLAPVYGPAIAPTATPNRIGYGPSFGGPTPAPALSLHGSPGCLASHGPIF